MAEEIYAGPVGEMRAVSTADGGTALTSTAVLIPLLQKTDHHILTPRNFAGGATVAKLHRNPFLIVLITRDSNGELLDKSNVAQDAGDAGTINLSSFPTLANGGAIYIGSHVPFRGVYVDGTAFNGTASTLTVEYWNGVAWVTITPSDGSASAGATFGQDGAVTWTVPTSWATGELAKMLGIDSKKTGQAQTPIYWTRWTVSAAFDSSTTVANLLSMNRSTAYSEWIAGQAWEEDMLWGPGGFGCIEALVNAGTANLIVNDGVKGNGGKFP